MIKVKYSAFFKTKRVTEIADLIATKITSNNTYYIHKSRGYDAHVIVDGVTFELMLKHSKMPIILSDDYIDLSGL